VTIDSGKGKKFQGKWQNQPAAEKLERERIFMREFYAWTPLLSNAFAVPLGLESSPLHITAAGSSNRTKNLFSLPVQ
jgi:hypothetical protein